MKWVKSEWLQILILLLPVCVAALLWDRLPERMPIHWNAEGKIDGYAARSFAAFFVPALNFFIVALFYFLTAIDPKIREAQPDLRKSQHRIIGIVRLVFSTFMAIVGLTVLGIGAGLALDMTRIMGIGSALLIGILGNFMGKIRPNYFTGVRTPWTLESPHVWTKTHRFAGRLMVVVAILILLSCFTLKGLVWAWAFGSLIVVMAIIPIVYSYIIYKKEHSSTEDLHPRSTP